MTRRLSALVPVAAALVLVTAAGSADAPTRTVTMPGKLYDPTQLSVLVGTSVTWKNDDSINHTVTADGDAFSSGYLPPGGAFTFTFAKQGRYTFHCTIHKFMRGEVDVFGLVLSGPEGPVASGQRVVFAGLAPPGTQSVTLRGAPTGDRVVRARPDGSFVAAVDTVVPGSFRAVAGRLVSPAVRVQVRPQVHAVRAGDAHSCPCDAAAPRGDRRPADVRPRPLHVARHRAREARRPLARPVLAPRRPRSGARRRRRDEGLGRRRVARRTAA